jgi:hypothetical protein
MKLVRSNQVKKRSDGSELKSATRDVAGWGLFNRKARWGLSWRGRCAFAIGIVSVTLLVIFTIYPFLAIINREKTDTLVVEGWVNQYVIKMAVVEAKSGYQHVYTTGGPVEGSGGYLNDYSTAAAVGAGRLRQAGLPSELVQMVPCHESGRDRTFNSAVALKNWFRDRHITVHAINVLTEGAHARRTRLLFQEAFGKDVTVGIISVASPDYDPKHWWRYSEGVREVIGETIAYLYAKLLFWPSKTETHR